MQGTGRDNKGTGKVPYIISLYLEEEKIIKHSAVAVHGAGADAADGVCRRG